MQSPGKNKLGSLGDSKSTKAMSSSKPVRNTVINDMKSRVNRSENFDRADKLKKMVDDPTAAIQNGVPWSSQEKIELKQATADFRDIQSEKKNIHASLDKIDSLFDEKWQQSVNLSESSRHLESKIHEIDQHLSQFEEKFKLLEEKGDDKTEEEIAWETEARQQVSTLMSVKTGLSNSFTEIQALQRQLNDAEKNIAEELDQLFEADDPTPDHPVGEQSAASLCHEMKEIKDSVVNFRLNIDKISSMASGLFKNFFESIKQISSKITSQLKSATATLAQSSTLLNNYPEPKMQMRM